MNLYTLKSRREFGMGLARKNGLDPKTLKTKWLDHLDRLIQLYVRDEEVKAECLKTSRIISVDTAGDAPFVFFSLLDYAMLSAFLEEAPEKIISDENKLYDSTRYRGEEKQPFFCLAGNFSYISQRVRGTFRSYFEGKDSLDYFNKQADFIRDYYGHDLYTVRGEENRWIVEMKDPPEVARNDCMANIYILYRGWVNMFSVQEMLKGKHVCREESCVALGDSTCRFVFEKLV